MDLPEYDYDQIDVYDAVMELVDGGELVLVLNDDPAKLRVRRFKWREHADVVLSEDPKKRAAFHASLAFHS